MTEDPKSHHSVEGAIPLGVPGMPAGRIVEPLRTLLSELEDGSGWEVAYDAYWYALVARSRPKWPPPDGRVNWLWLTDLDSCENSVDLGSPFAEVAASLATECRDVTYVGRDNLHGEIVRQRAKNALPDLRLLWPDASLAAWPEHQDVVTFVASVGWQERLPQELDELTAVVHTAYRMLRPGGWFSATVPNALWYQQLRHGLGSFADHIAHSYQLRGLIRRIRAAGFSECREYMATASSLVPHLTPLASMNVAMMFIPNRRAAIDAYQGLGMHAGRSALLARLGLGSLLFPVRLVLARK